jgi:hypothetical protein
VASVWPEEAGRLALHYADDFRLFEDVGWDRDDPRDSIRLTMPPHRPAPSADAVAGGS